MDGQMDRWMGGHVSILRRFYQRPNNMRIHRMENVAICKKKMSIDLDDIIIALNSLDNSALNMEAIELLQRVEPKPEEIKLYKDYVQQNKDEKKLTEEDRYAEKLILY